MSEKNPDPIQKMIDTLWASPDSRLGTKQTFTEAVEFCVGQYGLIDRLTPGAVVMRHNDPKTPGKIRVELANRDIILVLVFFKEAPEVKLGVEIPRKEWKESMLQNLINGALPGIVQTLMDKARAELTSEQKRKQPTILMPGG